MPMMHYTTCPCTDTIYSRRGVQMASFDIVCNHYSDACLHRALDEHFSLAAEVNYIIGTASVVQAHSFVFQTLSDVITL